MREFDRLPPALRRWLAGAALPWSARSVRAAWLRALKACDGCEEAALARMTRIEAGLLQKDAARIWGVSGAAPGQGRSG